MKILGFLAVALILIPVSAKADKIVYKDSLREKEVIITKETDTEVYIRGGTEGRSSAQIPRDALESIERWTPEENEALERKWEKEEKLREQEREEEEEFEKEMRAKGKVQVGNEWVDPDDAMKMKRLEQIEEDNEKVKPEDIRLEEAESDHDSALEDVEAERGNVLKRLWRRIRGGD